MLGCAAWHTRMAGQRATERGCAAERGSVNGRRLGFRGIPGLLKQLTRGLGSVTPQAPSGAVVGKMGSAGARPSGAGKAGLKTEAGPRA